jgi:hypothetical protein
MLEILFGDKAIKPNDNLLSEKIGKNFKYWVEIQKHVKSNYENTINEWKFYGKNYGWQLKTLHKKRNLFFLIPSELSFKIIFVFRDKAVEEIKKSNISDELKSAVVKQKKYAEGRGLSIIVKDKKYLADIKTLIGIKVSH